MTIRSFVLRQGRITSGQEKAFAQHWARYGIDLSDTPISADQLFSSPRPLIVEIGFGNGESLIEMAQNAPELGFIGIEVHRPGVGHALLQAAARELDNLRIIHHDAVDVLTHHIADNSISRVQIYFPDPWQKKRHHKRRLIQKPFTDLLHQKLIAGGELHCATDWQNYAEWIHDRLFNDPLWSNMGATDGYAPCPPWRVQTKFERRGLSKGHQVWDLRYCAVK
ncbi:tRNA (guanosine(46)-N7)-methyltransferase TrmB [Dichelobacter nodosus]|uniref:tRNA (guanine-N(7)-)-methyltransferase n=1 Tax=Dichelobacter nodosus (strain VCS1703A) TaxID=246195 RepID=A5EXA9_DICNV|nr:tRNA (guanosine(46)-N7)-methyltransferase TrmB [Dichelobacter nodosus]ABQ14165.1 tRNA (guanine-N(7)-)-methyltransferase [Dichelobacter nodosus VCS1703A]